MNKIRNSAYSYALNSEQRVELRVKDDQGHWTFNRDNLHPV